MGNFFSLNSDGTGKPLYFNAELRRQCREGSLQYNPDGHIFIVDYFGYKGEVEDKLNKYEYNPLTQVFKIVQLNTTDDSKEIELFCRGLDLKDCRSRANNKTDC